MSFEFSIPDPLYDQAKQMATVQGISLDRFLLDAVQLHLHDDPGDSESVTLTAEQVQIIRRSQADIREGKGMSLDQVQANHEKRKAEWLQNRN